MIDVGLKRLHQHRMFAVRAGESVSAIVGDGVELVEFVFTETFGAQTGDAKTKTGQRSRTTRAVKTRVLLLDKRPRPAKRSGLKPAVTIASARADQI